MGVLLSAGLRWECFVVYGSPTSSKMACWGMGKLGLGNSGLQWFMVVRENEKLVGYNSAYRYYKTCGNYISSVTQLPKFYNATWQHLISRCYKPCNICTCKHNCNQLT